MSKPLRTLALASACLFGSLCAAATESSAPVAVAQPPRAAIHCPGITSVPMTADAEQALPLRVVGDLSCGSVVSILADNEGYTAHVRTADGQDGYVARVYLTMGGDASSAANPLLFSASPVNGIVRWRSSASGCDQFTTNGHYVESASANGVTVQIALEDTGWKLRALIAVSNNGAETLEVVPDLVTLDELAPNLKVLPAVNPGRLAHAVNHQVLLSQTNAQPPRSAGTFTEVSTSPSATTVYHPSTPDYFSEHIFQASSSNSGAIVPSAAEIQALALKHTALAPGQETAGVMWFERSANARELSLRVPVGDLVFDFPLSFEQKK